MDPEDYSKLPLSQFEEDNVLREMNKSLLAFRQRRGDGILSSRHRRPSPVSAQESQLNADKLFECESIAGGEAASTARRLSPIGESFGSASPEVEIREPSSSRSDADDDDDDDDDDDIRRARPNGRSESNRSSSDSPSKVAGAKSKSRFIVLGSSGEILPVSRKSLGQMSHYGSCNSQSSESFHSAKDTLDDEQEDDADDDKSARRCTDRLLDKPSEMRRGTFAQRLKEALYRESTATGGASFDAHYSSVDSDQNAIRVERGGGSRGFVLRDQTVDEEFLKESLEAEQRWLGRFRKTQLAPAAAAAPSSGLERRDTNASSKYSFTSEYSSGEGASVSARIYSFLHFIHLLLSDFCSELEEVYEQLSKWLEDPVASDERREMDARDRAVVEFAGSLLRRALSESLAGVAVQEGEPQPFVTRNDLQQKHKLALAVRSLSLELARQRNKIQQSVCRDSPSLSAMSATKDGTKDFHFIINLRNEET